MHSSKRKRKMTTSSRAFFFSLWWVKQKKREFCIEILHSRCYCRRYDDVYIYIFSFFISIADGVYRYTILCCCRSLSFLFFDSIDARNGECSMLSLFLLLALLQSTLFVYSHVFLTLHLLVLFRCVPYVFFFEVT